MERKRRGKKEGEERKEEGAERQEKERQRKVRADQREKETQDSLLKTTGEVSKLSSKYQQYVSSLFFLSYLFYL